MDKQKNSDMYYDKSGYGSKAITLQDARRKDKTITMSDVNEFFKQNIEEKIKPRGQNSFVAPHSFWEFQLDLCFISKNDLENQKFRIGLILIDIFSKYATVIPIVSKQPADVLAGIMEGIKKIGGKPKIIYSDEEGSLFSSTITDYLDEEKMNYTPREAIRHLEKDLLEPLRICFLKELMRMKRKVETLYNG